MCSSIDFCIITYFVLIQAKASRVPCSSGWTAEIKITGLTCEKSSYGLKLERTKTVLIIYMYYYVHKDKTYN